MSEYILGLRGFQIIKSGESRQRVTRPGTSLQRRCAKIGPLPLYSVPVGHIEMAIETDSKDKDQLLSRPWILIGNRFWWAPHPGGIWIGAQINGSLEEMGTPRKCMGSGQSDRKGIDLPDLRLGGGGSWRGK